jgi:hypothetical protein
VSTPDLVRWSSLDTLWHAIPNFEGPIVAQLTPKDLEQPRSVQVKIRRILDKVQQFYEMGEKSVDLAPGARRKFDENSPIGPERMRRARCFAKEYNETALKRFMGHRKPNGLPLHVGYIPYLLTVKTVESRGWRGGLGRA